MLRKCCLESEYITEGEVHNYFLKVMYINRVVNRVPIMLNIVST